MTPRQDFAMSDGSVVNMVALWNKVARSDGCWNWRGATDRFGHGKILSRRDGRWFTSYAHRVSWEFSKGPIPLGCVVMHDCDNPRCVNPAHLSVGTQRENLQSGKARGRRFGRPFKSHCLRGHPFSGDNVKWVGGRRVCCACEALRRGRGPRGPGDGALAPRNPRSPAPDRARALAEVGGG